MSSNPDFVCRTIFEQCVKKIRIDTFQTYYPIYRENTDVDNLACVSGFKRCLEIGLESNLQNDLIKMYKKLNKS